MLFLKLRGISSRWMANNHGERNLSSAKIRWACRRYIYVLDTEARTEIRSIPLNDAELTDAPIRDRQPTVYIPRSRWIAMKRVPRMKLAWISLRSVSASAYRKTGSPSLICGLGNDWRYDSNWIMSLFLSCGYRYTCTYISFIQICCIFRKRRCLSSINSIILRKRSRDNGSDSLTNCFLWRRSSFAIGINGASCPRAYRSICFSRRWYAHKSR